MSRRKLSNNYHYYLIFSIGVLTIISIAHILQQPFTTDNDDYSSTDDKKYLQGDEYYDNEKKNVADTALDNVIVEKLAYDETPENQIVQQLLEDTHKNYHHNEEKFLSQYNYQLPSTITRENKLETICKGHPHYLAFFQLDASYRSRLNEDLWIYNGFFKSHVDNIISQGTYVELGAFDGRRESNTNFFDECLGWKGLLIEGNPRKYNDLLQNRPHAHRMNFAPSCQEEGSHVVFMATVHTNAGLLDKALTNDAVTSPKVDVPCGPLGPVLEHVFMQDKFHINLFSLDVEGAEELVLDTIDFDKVQIDVMIIEVVNGSCKRKHNCEVRNNVRSKMKNLGYKRYDEGTFLTFSDVYVHPNSTFQLNKAAYPSVKEQRP